MIGDHVIFRSDNDEWGTPEELFDSLDKEFHFDLDAAASDENHLCDDYFTKDLDGLTQSWKGKRVFVNPPYSKISGWVEKSYRETRNDGTLVVMLIPARTDTRYFHNYIYHRSEIRFVNRRVKFIGGGAKTNAPFPSMIVIFRGANL